MTTQNIDIARVFEQIAEVLEIEGANAFRIRAYRNAAQTLREMGPEVADLVASGRDLTELPGVGEDLAGKIKEVLATGTSALLEDHRKTIPESLTQLLKLPGLGPKRVKALYDRLGIRSDEDLYRAAEEGRVRALTGFGEGIERHILDLLQARRRRDDRFTRADAAPHAERLIAYLTQVTGVQRVEVAGSYRRGRETIGDLDILVAAPPGKTHVSDRFVAYPDVREVLAHGPTKSSVRLACGLQADLRVVPVESYGAALQYFTGSKAHSVVLRQIAQRAGLKLNEYGVFRGNRRVAGGTEESVYAALGLPWIPPALRENRGELEAAQAGRLPVLIELADVRGDLHTHTRAADGRDSLQDMVAAAQARGLEYLAITDHAVDSSSEKGLTPSRLLAQVEEIGRLNAHLSGLHVLTGLEVDIREDGSLDVPAEVLDRLDVVVGAIHSHFELPKPQQTARILRAMEHPRLTMLAHPTGRRLGEQEPYEVDMLRVIRKARACGCFLELNAQPLRLDLVDLHCQMAKDEQALISVNSDARSVQDFGLLRYGIDQARRGWLEKGDVVNTRSLKHLRPLLRRTP